MDKKMLVDCYPSRDGDVLRIDIQQQQDLDKLVEFFQSLANGKQVRRDLPELGNILFTKYVESVTCRLVGKEPRKALVARELRDGLFSFVWSRSSEGWLECAELLQPPPHEPISLEGMRTGPGWHQYLSSQGRDDALVEVAYGEPRPAGLEKLLRG